MGWLRKVFRRLLIRHIWVETGGDLRECSVCGRREEYDEVASLEGSVWNCRWEGYPGAHRTANKR